MKPFVAGILIGTAIFFLIAGLVLLILGEKRKIPLKGRRWGGFFTILSFIIFFLTISGAGFFSLLELLSRKTQFLMGIPFSFVLILFLSGVVVWTIGEIKNFVKARIIGISSILSAYLIFYIIIQLIELFSFS